MTVFRRTNVGIMLALLFIKCLQMALSQRILLIDITLVADIFFEGGSILAQQTQHLGT